MSNDNEPDDLLQLLAEYRRKYNDLDPQATMVFGAAEMRIKRLKKGIQDYLDGNYESARRHRAENVRYQCPHGQHYWESCEGCIDAHFVALLDVPHGEAP